jgi:hypothetical protein
VAEDKQAADHSDDGTFVVNFGRTGTAARLRLMNTAAPSNASPFPLTSSGTARNGSRSPKEIEMASATTAVRLAQKAAFEQGQRDARALLGQGGFTHNSTHARPLLRAQDDDGFDGGDDDEETETLVCTYPKGHVARHDSDGQLHVFKREKK